MHRETNLQVENEETIEAQSARTPKRCWTESNSAFSFACTDSFDGASARVTATSRVCVRTASFPRFARSPFSVSGDSFADAAQSCTGASGLPGWRARNASVTLGFRRPCGRENGRQFSYKHNAEEGVRLDEQRSTVDRGRRGGRRRPFVMGCAVGHRGVPEPFRGPYARSRALAGRCARIDIRVCVRIRMSGRFFDVSPVAGLAAAGRFELRADHRCSRNDHSRARAFLRFLHPDDTPAAHRDGRTIVWAGMRRAPGVSRENEHWRGRTR